MFHHRTARKARRREPTALRFCRPDCSYRAHRRRRGRDTRVCKPHTCCSRGAVCVAGCAPRRPGCAREAGHACGLLWRMRCHSPALGWMERARARSGDVAFGAAPLQAAPSASPPARAMARAMARPLAGAAASAAPAATTAPRSRRGCVTRGVSAAQPLMPRLLGIARAAAVRPAAAGGRLLRCVATRRHPGAPRATR